MTENILLYPVFNCIISPWTSELPHAKESWFKCERSSFTVYTRHTMCVRRSLVAFMVAVIRWFLIDMALVLRTPNTFLLSMMY